MKMRLLLTITLLLGLGCRQPVLASGMSSDDNLAELEAYCEARTTQLDGMILFMQANDIATTDFSDIQSQAFGILIFLSRLLVALDNAILAPESVLVTAKKVEQVDKLLSSQITYCWNHHAGCWPTERSVTLAEAYGTKCAVTQQSSTDLLSASSYTIGDLKDLFIKNIEANKNLVVCRGWEGQAVHVCLERIYNELAADRTRRASERKES